MTTVYDPDAVIAPVQEMLKRLRTHTATLGLEGDDEIQHLLTRLTEQSTQQPAHFAYLQEHELSQKDFITLMVTTWLRVMPTYQIIPDTVALCADFGDYNSYSLISTNVSEEGGLGTPREAHPNLLYQSFRILAESVFDVYPVDAQLAKAVALLLGEGEEESRRAVAAEMLKRDVHGALLPEDAWEARIAQAYYVSSLTPAHAVTYHNTMLENIRATKGQETLTHGDLTHWLAELMIRETMATLFIGVYQMGVVDRYREALGEALYAQASHWANFHNDESMGKEGGKDSSYEADHSEKALQAVLSRCHTRDDFKLVLETAVTSNDFREAVWLEMVQTMAQQRGTVVQI